MRIALVPSAYAPAVGGVEELTAKLAARLVDAGDEVQVWTIRHPEGLTAAEQISGIDVKRVRLPLPRLHLVSLIQAPFTMHAASRSLLDIARAFRPDILHVQCFSANGAYATWLSTHMGVPLVISLQGETVMDDMNIYDHSIALRTALRIGLRRANAVTGCSQFVLDDAIKRFGLASGTGHVIPNGVERYESTANGSLPLPFRRFIFAVGRVVPKKGFDLLISGFARIAHQHPDVGLVIGGVGSARSDLAELVTQLGLADRVVFPGVLSRNEVAWAMSAAEVFVLPSRIEPFGIVVLEALRAGCPTIVSSHGGAPEIIRDGSDGLVVDPFDTNALSAALHRVLVDRSLTQKLRVAGTARAANFEWASIAARYQHLYKEISA